MLFDEQYRKQLEYYEQERCTVITHKQLKPAFEFNDSKNTTYFKIYSDGRVVSSYPSQVNGDLIINHIPNQAYEQEKSKMTREEAFKKIETEVKKAGYILPSIGPLLITLEALGLIKFEEPKPESREIRRLCNATQRDKFNFRIEEWPEGYVLWSDGVVVWKSWEYFK